MKSAGRVEQAFSRDDLTPFGQEFFDRMRYPWLIFAASNIPRWVLMHSTGGSSLNAEVRLETNTIKIKDRNSIPRLTDVLFKLRVFAPAARVR